MIDALIGVCTIQATNEVMPSGSPASLLQEPVKGPCPVNRLETLAAVLFCTVARLASSLTGTRLTGGERQLRISLIKLWTLKAATPDLTRGILGLRLPPWFRGRVDKDEIEGAIM